MKSSTLLRLLCLAVCHSFAASLNLRWVEYTTKNATVCTHTACRSFVHIVFTADMSNITDSLVGGTQYSLDGGAKQQGNDIHFERHLVHGICDSQNVNCENTSQVQQMWNWGFESVSPSAATAPRTICPEIWALDATDNQQASLSIPCLELGVTHIPDDQLGMTMALNSFSSAFTSVCTESEDCRTNLHVVYTVAPPNPLASLEGGFEVSWDAGASWSSVGTDTYYEQHIDKSSTDGRWYQAWQADYDMLGQRQEGATEVCFAIWHTDPSTAATVWLDGAENMRCVPLCNTLVPFHYPDGYCPGAPEAVVKPRSRTATMRHMIVAEWTADSTATEQAHAVACLESLPLTVPQIITYTVGSDIGVTSGNLDWGLVGEFASVDDFEAYEASAPHQACLALLKPILEKKVGLEFKL